MLGLFKRRTVAIPDPLWHATVASLALVEARPHAEIERLRAHVGRFLATKAITAARGLELDDRIRMTVATLACLPVLNLGIEALAGWHEVIVYPGQFRVRRHDHDEAGTVVTEWDDELAGESWSHGPVILSWADIEQDVAEPHAGLNVVIHEIAHKLDMRDGESNGLPPQPLEPYRDFKRVMTAAYQRFVADLDAGRPAAIDEYAAEAPDEFFAVASEYYFSAPRRLRELDAEVHRVLAQLYGPVPG